MTAEDKIRKRIKSITMINGIEPSRILINDAEAEELGDIKEIDGVKLVRNKIKEDCVFYNKVNKDCNAMTELICKNKNCKRYNTTITQEEIKRSIRDYSLRRYK